MQKSNVVSVFAAFYVYLQVKTKIKQMGTLIGSGELYW